MTEKKVVRRIFIGVALIVMVTLLMTGAVVADGVPTVNGLYYGDGDESRYLYVGPVDDRNADLFVYQDGDTVYILVKANIGVNDNVFGDTSEAGDVLYLKSADWKGVGNQHNAKALIQSEHLEMTIECGEEEWTWSIDYLYDADGDRDPAEKDWLSDHLGVDGGGLAPPGLVTASSLQWNLNNSSWDVTLEGLRVKPKDWKSPDEDADDDVTDEGWSKYNGEFGWEWPVIYEMLIPNCPDPVIVVGEIHNSPVKGPPTAVFLSSFTATARPGTNSWHYMPLIMKR